MPEKHDNLKKQAQWQLSRANKPWIEKLRASIKMRKSIYSIRKQSLKKPKKQ